MRCPEHGMIDDRELINRFRDRITRMRVPVSGSLELTRRCNLRCIHCYARPASGENIHDMNELPTGDFLSIIDEIADAGCISLLITGGEPLLRSDFCDIYSYAKKKGIFVTVFSNGTLITDELLGLFDELPPYIFEISLYGSTPETYEKITGAKDSFRRCLQGIEQLLKRGINVRLKTVLMTLNRNELADMENMAESMGVKFRVDAAIFPRFNGDMSPLSLRVPPEEAVEIEFSDSRKRNLWINYFERNKKVSSHCLLYSCGAGVNHFHIDPYGNLQPCLMPTSLKYNLAEGSFIDGWNGIINRIRDKELGADSPCLNCRERALCGFCPSFFKLENGDEQTHSEYICSMGQYRFQTIKKLTGELYAAGN